MTKRKHNCQDYYICRHLPPISSPGHAVRRAGGGRSREPAVRARARQHLRRLVGRVPEAPSYGGATNLPDACYAKYTFLSENAFFIFVRHLPVEKEL